MPKIDQPKVLYSDREDLLCHECGQEVWEYKVQYGGKTYYIGQECFDKWMELLPTGTKMVKITSANDKGSYPLIKNPLTRQREKEQHEREHPVD